jgi:hypothetical protein
MRMIMFDPTKSQKSAQKDHERKFMKKSASEAKLDKFKAGEKLSVNLIKKTIQMSSVQGGLDTLKDIDIDGTSSKIEENLNFSQVAHTELDLDYLDELELNRAFNCFKDI